MLNTVLTAANIFAIVGEIKCSFGGHNLARLPLKTDNLCHKVYQCLRCMRIFIDSSLFVHTKSVKRREGCNLIIYCNECNTTIMSIRDCQGPWKSERILPESPWLITRTCECGNTRNDPNPSYVPDTHSSEVPDNNDDYQSQMIQDMMWDLDD